MTILTLMAGDPPSPLPETAILHELHSRWGVGENAAAVRRDEDSASAAVLGARAEHRSYPDCIYRVHAGQALYPTQAAIFGEVHPSDVMPRSLAVETTLFPFVFPSVSVVYAPLGVGHHVDHQIVRNWSLDLSRGLRQRGIEVRYYEEYPYTRDQFAIQRALDLLRPQQALRPEVRLLSAREMTAKTDAIACHRSQISTFWKSEAAMRRDVDSAFCLGDGQYGERFWHAAR